MRIRVAAVVLLCGLALASYDAFAKEGDKSVEASLNYGTESFDGLGGQWGITAGFGYELPKNLQGRVDVSYFRSSTDQVGTDVPGTRIPIDLGIRYYYPLSKIDSDLTAYGQGGLEMSFDDWKPNALSDSRSKTRFGGLIGAGAEYALDPQYSAVVKLQYHIIEGGYLSTGIGLCYRF